MNRDRDQPGQGMSRRNLLFVLSSPSGAGKTTVAQRLLAEDPDLVMSVSATTRPKRPGETEGRDYFFVDQAAFRRMIEAGELLEHATVFGNLYGTPKAQVDKALAAGKDVLFDVDWQGTQQLLEHDREDVVSIFILPPSIAELERRLHSRAQDAPHVVAERMGRAADEMSHYTEYDYIIVNEHIETSVSQVRAILTAVRLRRSLQLGLHQFVEGLRAKG